MNTDTTKRTKGLPSENCVLPVQVGARPECDEATRKETLFKQCNMSRFTNAHENLNHQWWHMVNSYHNKWDFVVLFNRIVYSDDIALYSVYMLTSTSSRRGLKKNKFSADWMYKWKTITYNWDLLVFGPEFAILRIPLPEWDRLGRNSSLNGFPQKDSPPAIKNIRNHTSDHNNLWTELNSARNSNSFSQNRFLVTVICYIGGRRTV